MWLKLSLILTMLTVSCNGHKNTSCNFNNYFDLCGWRITGSKNCVWKVNTQFYQGNKGSLRLKGVNQCSSTMIREFGWREDHSLNYLSFDYYFIGPGPFKLSVSHDEKPKQDWSCTIQTGNKKRTAHLVVAGSASSIEIKGDVPEGSTIIITQIWDDLRGQKARHFCPSLPTTPGPPTTTTTTTTKIPSISNIGPLASTTRISKNSAQPTVTASPELKSNNVRSEKQVEKAKTRKTIIGGVVGGLTVIIAIVIVSIFIIIKRRRRTAYQINELPEKIGKSVPYENMAIE